MSPREPEHRSPGRWALSLREFLATYGSRTALLEPPYRVVKPLTALAPQHQPPLGTIAIGRGADLFMLVSELWLLMQHWHWVVPSITLRRTQWRYERLLTLFPDFSTRLAIGRTEKPNGLKAALAAVRRRPLPTPHVLARWVCERIGAPAHYGLFLAQFKATLGGGSASRVYSAATASRHFRHLGRYTASDWRALARLSVEHCEPTASADRRVPWVPDVRHIRKYLKTPVATAATLLGWEWVMEQALRVGRYVKVPKGPPGLP